MSTVLSIYPPTTEPLVQTDSRWTAVLARDAAADGAEAAGYRACRRCRPGDAIPNELEVIESLCREMERDADAPATLDALAARTRLAPHRLQRAFKRVTGITPRQYQEACRMRSLRTRLRDGHGITRAMF